MGKVKKKIKSEFIVALAAIFVSTATMFVYIYQTRIMKTQQHLAVWPHVEFLPSSGDNWYYLEVTNKGIGPALVKKVTIKLDGKEMTSFSEMFNVLTDSTFDNYYGYSTIEGRVIAPNEIIRPFQIIDAPFAKVIQEEMSKRNFEYEICYCSVFNDCWVSYGTSVEESDCN